MVCMFCMYHYKYDMYCGMYGMKLWYRVGVVQYKRDDSRGG